MLERISTTAMTASRMPKYGEPIEANFGGAAAGRVLAEVMGIPFIVVRLVPGSSREDLGSRLY